MDKQRKTLKKCSASTDIEAATEPLQNVKETPKEKKVEEEVYECCFETKDAEGNNEYTIFVSGFGCSLTRNDVKSALKKHFRSCRQITRIFVPIECKTGSPLGFAFVDLARDAKKALTLDGSFLEGLKLTVTMAMGREEYICFTNFSGCKNCIRILRERWYPKFGKNFGGRIHPRIPEFDKASALYEQRHN